MITLPPSWEYTWYDCVYEALFSDITRRKSRKNIYLGKFVNIDRSGIPVRIKKEGTTHVFRFEDLTTYHCEFSIMYSRNNITGLYVYNPA